MSQQLQCPHMHYHPWCDDCQTLMGWEPPQPIRPKPKRSIPTFGVLKKVVEVSLHYQSPFGYQIWRAQECQKVCSEWRGAIHKSHHEVKHAACSLGSTVSPSMPAM